MNDCCWYREDDGKDKCGYWMPDSWHDCVGCNNCGIYKEERKMDNKFNTETIEKQQKMYATPIMNKVNKAIEGVGEDAEVVVNEKGGKQSKSPMAMHLLDPKYLKEWAEDKAETFEYLDEGDSTCVDIDDIEVHGCYKAIQHIAEYMLNGIDFNLTMAMDSIECEELQQVIKIAKILQYGADRYAPNNWRLIPEEEHINHALIHLVAHIAGDTQDNHLDHALCRLMMAKATDKSGKFEYGEYVA